MSCAVVSIEVHLPNCRYIREGVLKRSIVYLSWKNRLLQIFYDLASEVMNEGKYSSFRRPGSGLIQKACVYTWAGTSDKQSNST